MSKIDTRVKCLDPYDKVCQLLISCVLEGRVLKGTAVANGTAKFARVLLHDGSVVEGSIGEFGDEVNVELDTNTVTEWVVTITHVSL